MSENPVILPRNAATIHDSETSYMDWPATLAGAAIAAAIAFVFSAFGTALGLTFLSPYEGEGSEIAVIIATGIWAVWTAASSFMVGGYVAGRMRCRIPDASPDEVSIRDGIHGVTVWAVGVLLGALILGGGMDNLSTTASDMAGAGAGADMSAAEIETARFYAVISAFVGAAALLISGVAAYWMATIGGQHRDEGTMIPGFGISR